MAAVQFPNSRRLPDRLSLARSPIEEFQGQNGAVTAVKFGNCKANSELVLTFQNITDAQGYEIFQNHETVMGTVPVVNGKSEWNYIEFPAQTLGRWSASQMNQCVRLRVRPLAFAVTATPKPRNL